MTEFARTGWVWGKQIYFLIFTNRSSASAFLLSPAKGGQAKIQNRKIFFSFLKKI